MIVVMVVMFMREECVSIAGHVHVASRKGNIFPLRGLTTVASPA